MCVFKKKGINVNEQILTGPALTIISESVAKSSQNGISPS